MTGWADLQRVTGLARLLENVFLHFPDVRLIDRHHHEGPLSDRINRGGW